MDGRLCFYLVASIYKEIKTITTKNTNVSEFFEIKWYSKNSPLFSLLTFRHFKWWHPYFVSKS
jgi:hypothetical protein